MTARARILAVLDVAHTHAYPCDACRTNLTEVLDAFEAEVRERCADQLMHISAQLINHENGVWHIWAEAARAVRVTAAAIRAEQAKESP